MLSVSGQCMVAQARSALLASSPCALYSVSWRPPSLFGLLVILFILLPPFFLPFYFSSDKSVCAGLPGACFAKSVSTWTSRGPTSTK